MTVALNDLFLKMHGDAEASYGIACFTNDGKSGFAVVKYETLPLAPCVTQTIVTIVDTIEAARAVLPNGFAKVLAGTFASLPTGCEFWQREGTVVNGPLVKRLQAMYSTFDEAKDGARWVYRNTKDQVEIQSAWVKLSRACRGLYPAMSKADHDDFVDLCMGFKPAGVSFAVKFKEKAEW